VKEQSNIPKHKIGRAAALLGAGARVGANYLKYRGLQKLTGHDGRAAFHEATAAQAFETFSHLKGGPLKLAQMLSLDRNLLPEPYADAFAQARYSAPPLSYPLVVRTVQRETGRRPDELFDTFSQQAIAGASIGQVHRATQGGRDLAVKIQYPGIADSVRSDLAIVKPLAMRLFNLNAHAIAPYLAEVESRLLEETDYTLELHRSQDLAARSSHLPRTRFPDFLPALSSRRILTMEWVDGELLDAYAARQTSQAARDRIGRALWDFYHHQIHTLRIFHADPHPGNFMVKGDELWVLDFGCVKSLPEKFYREYFSLMNPENLLHRERFESILRALGLLLPDDPPRAVRKLTRVFHESVALLSRPFHRGEFDFGDRGYFDELASFGERTRQDAELQQINTARGSADAIYLNRTYFGLYHLAGSLGARIRTTLPVM